MKGGRNHRNRRIRRTRRNRRNRRDRRDRRNRRNHLQHLRWRLAEAEVEVEYPRVVDGELEERGRLGDDGAYEPPAAVVRAQLLLVQVRAQGEQRILGGRAFAHRQVGVARRRHGHAEQLDPYDVRRMLPVAALRDLDMEHGARAEYACAVLSEQC